MIHPRRRLLALLLHILAIFNIQAQTATHYSPPCSSVPPVSYQTQQDIEADFDRVFGDQFEVPLCRQNNVYLAGFDNEIYKLKEDVARESIRNEVRVFFYLWTHHGFEFITTLHTDYETLQRNINKYHHYFQLKKVYIERLSKKSQWHIEKLIMLPSAFADDLVLKKYGHPGELLAAVEDPNTVILPEGRNHPDAIKNPELEPEKKKTDVLLDIYKEMIGQHDKQYKKKQNKNEIELVSNDAINTGKYRTYILYNNNYINPNEDASSLDGTVKIKEPKIYDKNSLCQSIAIPKIFTEPEAKNDQNQNRKTCNKFRGTVPEITIGDEMVSEYSTQPKHNLEEVNNKLNYFTTENESFSKPKEVHYNAHIYPYFYYYKTRFGPSFSKNLYYDINSQKNGEGDIRYVNNYSFNDINCNKNIMKSAAKIVETDAKIIPYTSYKTHIFPSTSFEQFNVVDPMKKDTVLMKPIEYSKFEQGNQMAAKFIPKIGKSILFSEIKTPAAYSQIENEDFVDYNESQRKHHPAIEWTSKVSPIQANYKYTTSLEKPMEYNEILAKFTPTQERMIRYRPIQDRQSTTGKTAIESSKIKPEVPIYYGQFSKQYNPAVKNRIKFGQIVEHPKKYDIMQETYSPIVKTPNNDYEPVDYIRNEEKHKPIVFNKIAYPQTKKAYPDKYDKVQPNCFFETKSEPLLYNQIKSKYKPKEATQIKYRQASVTLFNFNHIQKENKMPCEEIYMQYTPKKENTIEYTKTETGSLDYNKIISKYKPAVMNQIGDSQVTETPIGFKQIKKGYTIPDEKNQAKYTPQKHHMFKIMPVEFSYIKPEFTFDYNNIRNQITKQYRLIYKPIQFKTEKPEEVNKIETRNPAKYSQIQTTNLKEYNQIEEENPTQYKPTVKNVQYTGIRAKEPEKYTISMPIKHNPNQSLKLIELKSLQNAITETVTPIVYAGNSMDNGKLVGYPEMEAIKTERYTEELLNKPVEYIRTVMVKPLEYNENLPKSRNKPAQYIGFNLFQPFTYTKIPAIKPVQRARDEAVTLLEYTGMPIDKSIQYIGKPIITPVTKTAFKIVNPLKYTGSKTVTSLEYTEIPISKLLKYPGMETIKTEGYTEKLLNKPDNNIDTEMVKPLEYNKNALSISTNKPAQYPEIESFQSVKYTKIPTNRPAQYIRAETVIPMEYTGIPIDKSIHNIGKSIIKPVTNTAFKTVNPFKYTGYKTVTSLEYFGIPINKQEEYPGMEAIKSVGNTEKLLNKPVKYIGTEMVKPMEYNENLAKSRNKPAPYTGIQSFQPDAYAKMPTNQPAQHTRAEAVTLLEYTGVPMDKYIQYIGKPIITPIANTVINTFNPVKFTRRKITILDPTTMEITGVPVSQYTVTSTAELDTNKLITTVNPVLYTGSVTDFPMKCTEMPVSIQYNQPTITLDKNTKVDTVKPLCYYQNDIVKTVKYKGPQTIVRVKSHDMLADKLVQNNRILINKPVLYTNSVNPVVYISMKSIEANNGIPTDKLIQQTGLETIKPIKSDKLVEHTGVTNFKPTQYTEIETVNHVLYNVIPTKTPVTHTEIEHIIPPEYTQIVKPILNTVQYSNAPPKEVEYWKIEEKSIKNNKIQSKVPNTHQQIIGKPVKYSYPQINRIKYFFNRRGIESLKGPIRQSQIQTGRHNQPAIITYTPKLIGYSQPPLNQKEYNEIRLAKSSKHRDMPDNVIKYRPNKGQPIQERTIAEIPFVHRELKDNQIEYKQILQNPCENVEFQIKSSSSQIKRIENPIQFTEIPMDSSKDSKVQSVQYNPIQLTKPTFQNLMNNDVIPGEKQFNYWSVNLINNQIIEKPVRFFQLTARPVEYNKIEGKCNLNNRPLGKSVDNIQATKQVEYVQPIIYTQPPAQAIDSSQPVVQPSGDNQSHNQPAIKIINNNKQLENPISYSNIDERPKGYNQEIENYELLPKPQTSYSMFKYNQPTVKSVENPFENDQLTANPIEQKPLITKDFSNIADKYNEFNQSPLKPLKYHHKAIEYNDPKTKQLKYGQTAVNQDNYNQKVAFPFEYTQPRAISIQHPVAKLIAREPMEYNQPVKNLKSIIYNHIAEPSVRYNEPSVQYFNYNQFPANKAEYKHPIKKPTPELSYVEKPVDYNQPEINEIKYIKSTVKPFENNEETVNPIEYNQIPVKLAQPVKEPVGYAPAPESTGSCMAGKPFNYFQPANGEVEYIQSTVKPFENYKQATKSAKYSKSPTNPIECKDWVTKSVVFPSPKSVELRHKVPIDIIQSSVNDIKFIQSSINTISYKQPIVKPIEYNYISQKPVQYDQPEIKHLKYNTFTELGTPSLKTFKDNQPTVKQVNLGKQEINRIKYGQPPSTLFEYSQPPLKPIVNYRETTLTPIENRQTQTKPIDYDQPAAIIIEYSQLESKPFQYRHHTSKPVKYEEIATQPEYPTLKSVQLSQQPLKNVEYYQLTSRPNEIVAPQVIEYNQPSDNAVIADNASTNSIEFEPPNNYNKIIAKYNKITEEVIQSQIIENPLEYGNTPAEYNPSQNMKPENLIQYYHQAHEPTEYRIISQITQYTQPQLIRIKTPFRRSQYLDKTLINRPKPHELMQRNQAHMIITPGEWNQSSDNSIKYSPMFKIQFYQPQLKRVITPFNQDQSPETFMENSPIPQKSLFYNKLKSKKATIPTKWSQFSDKLIDPQQLIKYEQPRVNTEDLKPYSKLAKKPSECIHREINPKTYSEIHPNAEEKENQKPKIVDIDIDLMNNHRQLKENTYYNSPYLPNYVWSDNRIDKIITRNSPKEKKILNLNTLSSPSIPETYTNGGLRFIVIPTDLPVNKENSIENNYIDGRNYSPKFDKTKSLKITPPLLLKLSSKNAEINNYGAYALPNTRSAFAKPQKQYIPNSFNSLLHYKINSFCPEALIHLDDKTKSYGLPKQDFFTSEDSIDYTFDKQQNQVTTDNHEISSIKPYFNLYTNIYKLPRKYTFNNNNIAELKYDLLNNNDFARTYIPVDSNKFKQFVNEINNNKPDNNLSPKQITSNTKLNKNQAMFVNGQKFMPFNNFINTPTITAKKEYVQSSFNRYSNYPYINKFDFTNLNHNRSKVSNNVITYNKNPHNCIYAPVYENDKIINQYQKTYKPKKLNDMQQKFNSVNSKPKFVKTKNENFPNDYMYSSRGDYEIVPNKFNNIEHLPLITPLSADFKSNKDLNPFIVDEFNTYSPISTNYNLNSLDRKIPRIAKSANLIQYESTLQDKPLNINSISYQTPYTPCIYGSPSNPSQYLYSMHKTPSYPFFKTSVSQVHSKISDNIDATDLTSTLVNEKSSASTYTETPKYIRPSVSNLPTNSYTNNNNLKHLTSNIKTSINNWLKTNPTNIESIPVGEFGLAKLEKDNKKFDILKTDDPNVIIKTWTGKIKVIKAILLFKTEEMSVTHFLPIIVKGNYDPLAIQYMVKEEIKKRYGEPIVIKGTSFYKPYVVINNSEMHKSGRFSILWPTFNKKLNYWVT